jgi:acyl transferase domain-containing protein
LYANGTDIDWELLYSGIRRNRVSLPTYPFDRTRCWFETGQAGGEQTGDLYRTLKWVPEPLAEPSTANEHGGCTLLIKGDGERGTQLADLLRSRPGTVIEVEIEPEGGFRNLAANRYSIGESEDCYFRLIQAVKGSDITKIVHLATCSGEGEWTASSDSAEELQGMKQRGIYSLHYLVKALTANNVKRGIELVLVSEYVHEVTGREERLLPYNALLFGLGKVVPLEYANLSCRCIDMDRETSTEALIDELYSTGNRYQVAYRHGVRHAEEFGKMDLPKAAAGITEIRRGGTYVITGGLGGIGLEIGKYLSSRNPIHLVLINRSPFPDRSLWQTLLAAGEDDKLCKKIAAIRDIEATGSDVTCYSADVGDFQKLASVFTDVRAKFGRINGIVHGAGLVDGAVLIRKDKEYARRGGAWGLYGGERLLRQFYGLPQQAWQKDVNHQLVRLAGNRDGRRFRAEAWRRLQVYVHRNRDPRIR